MFYLYVFDRQTMKVRQVQKNRKSLILARKKVVLRCNFENIKNIYSIIFLIFLGAMSIFMLPLLHSPPHAPDNVDRYSVVF
jgi:hypothetical protein